MSSVSDVDELEAIKFAESKWSMFGERFLKLCMNHKAGTLRSRFVLSKFYLFAVSMMFLVSQRP